jgi:glycosyltransferase involved in cell wall biosynthesis
MTPTVSFVVPCYKFAHLLPECINSILSQTYGDFEVLTMDDCSPDNTPEVAQSFRDPRVKYIRNDSNLGHLANYNKGISLTRGEYIWLISADDYLRRQYILERYVNLLDGNPRVGYAFCPGISVRNGRETDILEYSVHGNRDRIISGHVLLKKLLTSNVILTASGMARRECYERISFFPLSMPWAGDWYLWCLFALYFDVGYFAEPMVCYREHDLSMTNSLLNRNLENCAAEEIAMPWLIRQKADEVGYRRVSRECLRAAANEYARSVYAQSIGAKLYPTSRSYMGFTQFEESLCQNTANETERNWVRARVYAGIADRYYCRGEVSLARRFYFAGLQKDPWMLKTIVKRLLLLFGNLGNYLRRSIRRFREERIVGR